MRASIFSHFWHHLRLQQVILIAIFCLGLWLRLNNLDQTMWFFDGTDEARDVLVAKQIVEHHEVITRGPFAAGGYFWLENSPAYYYFMAVLWFFGRNPIGTIVVWAIVSTSGVLLSYWAGKLTRNTLLGLLAALLYAIHPNLVTMGNQIIQPHLLPLFALLFYCSLLTAWKQKSSLWLIAAGLWLLLPIHIHYGSLLLWPTGGLALATTWYLAIKNHWHEWKVSLGFSLLLSAYLLGAWLFLTYKHTPGDQFYFFTINAHNLGQPFWTRLMGNSEHLKNLVLSFVPNWVGLAALTSLLIGWLVTRKKLTDHVLFFLTLSVGLTLIFRNYVAETYMMSIFPFWIILVARVIQTSFTVRWWLGVVVVSFIGWWWRDMTALRISDLPDQSYYQHFENVTAALHQDYLNQAGVSQITTPPEIAIAVLASYAGIPYDGWRNSPYWLFLEQRTGQKLVTLTDYDTNFIAVNQTAKYFYLICDRRSQPEKAWEMCYQAFTRVRDYLNVGSLIYNDSAFLIWRFTIDQTKLPKHFYLVYPEYM